MVTDFIFLKDEAIERARNILKSININIIEEKELNYGHKFVCQDKLGIIVYFKNGKSSKIVVENDSIGIDEKLINTIKGISKQSAELSENNDKVDRMQIHASYSLSNEYQDKIKNDILQTFQDVEEKDIKRDTILYCFKISDKNNTLTVTQFKTGSFLLQGLDSQIVVQIKEIINRYELISNIDNALMYVPEKEKEQVSEIFKKLEQDFSGLANKAKDKISVEAYNFLFDNDKQEFVSGIGILEALSKTETILPSYNWLVYPFGKVFEGFVIKLMLCKSMFTYEQFKQNSNVAEIGNCLRKGFFEKYIKDVPKNQFIINKMTITWEWLRCAQLHSDPTQNSNIITLTNVSQADNKIGEICSCVTDAYRILVSEGYTEAEMKQKKTGIVDKDRSINNIPIKPIEKEIPKFESHIGTDESGKGDYLGSLVISGVYVDNNIETKLKEIGVQDSKKNSDSKNRELAFKIKRILNPEQYSIVCILPEKYNELYAKMENLNAILAWGHARALENVLDKIPCKNAIADQFGDESYIKEALMKHGKSIMLIQTPKAERDIAVAAASILARDQYLQSLSELSNRVGICLHKGASPEVEKDAISICKKVGKDSLVKFAKIHFKTTDKIKGDL